MGLTYARALKILVQAARRELQLLAFDANLYKMGVGTSPHFEHAFIKREKIREAIDFLEAKGKEDDEKTGK